MDYFSFFLFYLFWAGLEQLINEVHLQFEIFFPSESFRTDVSVVTAEKSQEICEHKLLAVWGGLLFNFILIS